DVWLVHLTGEEFPGDDLGARELVRTILAGTSPLQPGQRLRGFVLLDMIGTVPSKEKARPIVQLNAGEGEESLALAGVALSSVAHVAPALTPVFRSRFDPRSYLYNTDGLVFSNAGVPVVFLNEHINYLENYSDRELDNYHTTQD